MKQLSDRALVLLIAVAVVLSLCTTVITIFRTMHTTSISGAATTQAMAHANISILPRTEIQFTISSIDFGTGYVNQSCSSCNMTSNGSITSGCCIDFSSIDQPLVIENTGNQDVYLYLNSTKNASEFLGMNGSIEPLLRWRVSPMSIQSTSRKNNLNFYGAAADDINPACSSGALSPTNWADVNRSSPGHCVCGPCDGSSYNFVSDNSQDEIVIDIFMSIPNTETGYKEVRFYATATSS